MKQLRMGVVGLGVGASAVLPTMAAMPEIELVAGADVDPAMRAGFLERSPGRASTTTSPNRRREADGGHARPKSSPPKPAAGSSIGRCEITLERQVAMAPAYDAELDLAGAAT